MLNILADVRVGEDSPEGLPVGIPLIEEERLDFFPLSLPWLVAKCDFPPFY